MRRLKSTLTSRFYKRKVDITVFSTLPLEDQLVSPMEQLHFLIGYGLLRPTLRYNVANNHFHFAGSCWWLVESPDSTIHKAAGLMVPGHSMIWLVQFLKICEAIDRGMVSDCHSCQQHFLLFCREQLVTYSAIHKAAGLMVPGHSIIWLVQFHCSTKKCPIGCEWELLARTPSGGGSSWWLFGNGQLLRSQQLCE